MMPGFEVVPQHYSVSGETAILAIWHRPEAIRVQLFVHRPLRCPHTCRLRAA